MKLIPALVLGLFSGYASAAGFQLIEQNASGMGNAYAGSAAVAENASTIYYNPAGMTYLPGRNFSAGVSAIGVSFKFKDAGTTNPTALGGGAATGGNGGDAGGWGFLPNGYLSWQLNDRWFAGIGFGAPFGLKTDYDKDWKGRYHSTLFDIKTYNINPSIAWKANEVVSLGFGVNWQRIDATFDKAAVVGLGAGGGAPYTTARVSNELNSDAWGWNAGAIFQISPSTRVGASYRSKIKHKADGDQTFGSPFNAALNGSAKATVELPDTFILSAQQQLSDRWELLGDVSWTGWSSIQSLVITGSTTGSSEMLTKFRDTWRVALGANYKYNDAWKLKFGVAYDQSPVDSAKYRTASLPDNNRTWLSLGAQYKLSKDSVLDVGYSHLFVKDSNVANDEDTAARGLLAGTYEASADLVGIQYSLSF
ncbi:OmpP1/FadL family transporter [Rhodocyclus tenuis]|uniref:Long-chain fatty acid transport protein n=1 Tax=Rhodocyclus tenuis TaxID=1066 RepID=A0A840FUV2_RHOTE|nr:outer membrane protein transport protein [Rhodocyclus tenuis]MBB4245867.1 long-chain fatty acid transport protein [Rhodocyclus tenuis]